MCACVCSLLFDLQVRNAAALSVKSAVAHSQRSLEPRAIRDPLLVRSPEHHITWHTSVHQRWVQYLHTSLQLFLRCTVYVFSALVHIISLTLFS